ncbi:MAG: TonB family protein [Gemmatimonadota bacterium]
MGRSRRAWACALVGLLASGLFALGCATTGRGHRSSDCTSELAPDTASLEEVADSASLRRDITDVWTPVTGRVVASLVYDSLGSLDTAHVWSSSPSDVVRRRLEKMLMAHAHAAGSAGQRVYLFVGDEGGPKLRRVPGLRTCLPRMLHTERLARSLRAEARSLGVSYMTRVDVLVFVRGDGRVGEVRVDKTSGNPAVDEAALRVLRDAAFAPGAIEGIPVALWTSFPVTFTPTPRGGPG